MNALFLKMCLRWGGLRPVYTRWIGFHHTCIENRHRFHATAGGKDVAFQVEASEGLPGLRGTEEVFARIFSNIVSNAVKFSRAGEIIQVRVSSKVDGVTGEVQDRGIGISPEDLPHITSRFFR